MLKATCNLQIGVRLGNLPMVCWTYFCRCCSFTRQVFAANSQTWRG